ncbi:MAG: DivIVA domain-containing protein [Clostridium sp.]|jgi:cell division initiation protein|nr:DivIVA domain-containing protein [Clostridium sp.]
MKLTPMDINNKEFKRVLRGYSPEEVDEFLDEVVESYEELFKEKSKLEEKLAAASEQINHYSKIETTIQNTLLLAQNAADSAKETAQREADLMLKNANEAAQKILDRANNDIVTINDEYEKTKQEYIKFRAKYKNFVKTQLETFEDLERDMNKNFSIATPVEEEKKEVVELKDEDVKPIETEEELDEGIEEIKSFFANNEDDNVG